MPSAFRKEILPLNVRRPHEKFEGARELRFSGSRWPAGLAAGSYWLTRPKKTKEGTVADASRLWILRQAQPRFSFLQVEDSYRSEHKTPGRAFTLWIAPDWLEKHFGKRRLPVDPLHLLEDEQIISRLDSLEAILHRAEAPSALQIESQFLILLGDLVERFGQNHRLLSGKLPSRSLERIYERIYFEPAAGFSVAELAEEAGLSPAHFARTFHGTTGLSPWQYVLRIRLEQAKDQLARRERTPSEVALALGFSDQAHFTRHFKRAFGVAPGMYQAALRK